MVILILIISMIVYCYEFQNDMRQLHVYMDELERLKTVLRFSNENMCELRQENPFGID